MSWTYPATALASYLIGAIPFGYLIYYALTKEDVRKLGSGNIGATNVGRLLGFRFFVLVFVLDVLKGLFPTIGLPWLVARLGGDAPADLPVAAALGAILGHNFPVYLGFKGGKGVATSLGALLALQPAACGVAAVAFFTVFFISRYVSLSSMIAGVAFAAAYFWRTVGPWEREHRAMSLFVTAVVVLLIARHRKNIGRLLAGTENRVNLGRRKPDGPAPPQPAGMVRPVVIVALAFGALAVLGVVGWIHQRAGTPVEAVAGPWRMIETHREATGQQRSSRVAFDGCGDHLAVLCPRYNRILTYAVDADAKLGHLAEIAVEGRPVAMAVVAENVVVLQRPVNDAKHLGPGWIDAFTLEGTRVGTRVEAGYYPDDLAATPDGRHLFVASSGRAEGDADKHLPALSVFLTSDVLAPKPATPVATLTLEKGDPERLILSSSGARALLTLARERAALAIDLADPAAPRLAGDVDLSRVDVPYVSRSEDGDWIVVPGRERLEAVAFTSRPEGEESIDGAEADSPAYLAVSRPEDSMIDVVQVEPTAILGRFPVLGPLNLGGAETSALAYDAHRRLLVVATKPGAVHVVRLESRLNPAASVPPSAPRFAASR